MVFVIAEAGINHNGDLENALALCNAASRAGANAVKFQTFDPEALDPPGERRDMLKKHVLNKQEHLMLKARCKNLGIEFMSTPFDLKSLHYLVNELGVKRLKIASGNLDNLKLLEAARDCGLPTIVSTGAATLGEVVRASSTLPDATYLHCVSCYPAPAEATNLLAIPAMKAVVKHVGFSDHSMSLAIPCAAVALGAEVIEKHLTLNRNMQGPDHAASFEPAEFDGLVAAIRQVERSLGDGEKKPQDCESVVAKVIGERRAWRAR